MSVDINGHSPNPDDMHEWNAEPLTHHSRGSTWLRWTMESIALVSILSAVFYVGYLEGVRYGPPSSCILPMQDGSALELKKINP